MKSVLVLAILSVVVVAAMAAKSCGTVIAPRDCEGPVQIGYAQQDCKGASQYSEILAASGLAATGSGKCHNLESGGSAKFWCGSRISGKQWSRADCKGPSTSSWTEPTGKCIDNSENTSFKLQCASAPTITISAALFALLALIGLLL